jgi:hypothetical protein
MGARGARERFKAQHERDAAEVEHIRAEDGGTNAALHRQVERRHREAAAMHEHAAALFDAHDDPDVSEVDAIAIADRELRGLARSRDPK